MKRVLGVLAFLAMASFSIAVPLPYMRLADNLNEERDYGFCFDLKGWRNSLTHDNMQIHSCKPELNANLDVQWVFSGNSVHGPAENSLTGPKCVEAESLEDGSVLHSRDCDNSKSQQQFCWDDDASLRAVADTSLCLAAFGNMRDANTYKAFNFRLLKCDSVDAGKKQWQQLVPSGSALPSSPAGGTRIPKADCKLRDEHGAFARTHCPMLCELPCSSTTTSVTDTTVTATTATSTYTSVTTATLTSTVSTTTTTTRANTE
eukprot:gene21581-19151_t